MLVDTHAHLDDPLLWNRLDEVVERARSAGVGRILAVGSDLASSARAVEAASRYSMVYAAVGIHPHMALRFEEERQDIEALLDVEKVVAVGEIGLDYYRLRADPETQRQAFVTQLEWARSRDLPASVHNREADNDILQAVEETGARVILHAFSSRAEMVRAGERLGAYVSFAGNVTFPRAETLRDAARVAHGERILVESDAPVLAPQPRRGRTNEPGYVAFTLQSLAETRNQESSELEATIAHNADEVFGWGVG